MAHSNKCLILKILLKFIYYLKNYKEGHKIKSSLHSQVGMTLKLSTPMICWKNVSLQLSETFLQNTSLGLTILMSRSSSCNN